MGLTKPTQGSVLGAFLSQGPEPRREVNGWWGFYIGNMFYNIKVKTLNKYDFLSTLQTKRE